MDDGGPPARLLIIGGAEDRCCGSGLLDRFAGLCGGEQARIVLVTTATDLPVQAHADYDRVFRKLGVERITELRLYGRADADGAAAAAVSARVAAAKVADPAASADAADAAEGRGRSSADGSADYAR